MRVVHINVRLSEGGAARVALDLHRRLVETGIVSQFFYGYGRAARPSLVHADVEGAYDLSSRHRIFLNYATHRIVGMEFLPPRKEQAYRLRQAIASADVVHLHAVHSYFLPFGYLADALAAVGRILWTCHDFWPITGRCGFLEGCEGWRNGCGICPTGTNYPPALLDFSATAFRTKRVRLASLLDRITFVAPSRFVERLYREALPAANVTTIFNGIDSDLERAIVSAPPVPEAHGNESTSILIMASDLSDPTKVDRGLIQTILRLPGIKVSTIGRNSPFNERSVTNYGEIRARTQLVDIARTAHALLFTSTKDTFGLVMIEAMVCGIPVLAVTSDAADEVLSLVNQRSMANEEIVALLADEAGRKVRLSRLKAELREQALSVFSGANMFRQYVKLYRSRGGTT